MKRILILSALTIFVACKTKTNPGAKSYIGTWESVKCDDGQKTLLKIKKASALSVVVKTFENKADCSGDVKQTSEIIGKIEIGKEDNGVSPFDITYERVEVTVNDDHPDRGEWEVKASSTDKKFKAFTSKKEAGKYVYGVDYTDPDLEEAFLAIKNDAYSSYNTEPFMPVFTSNLSLFSKARLTDGKKLELAFPTTEAMGNSKENRATSFDNAWEFTKN